MGRPPVTDFSEDLLDALHVIAYERLLHSPNLRLTQFRAEQINCFFNKQMGGLVFI